MPRPIPAVFRAVPIALGLACLLAACAGVPTTVHVTLAAGPGVNPDGVGQPNPVQVHLFLLKNADLFNNTDYFQLTDKERTVLGADLLADRREIVHPGQTRSVDLPVVPGTGFVAVSAAFRNIDQATWRAVTPLAGKVTVTLGPDTVKAAATQ